jgi:hypothetical protein
MIAALMYETIPVFMMSFDWLRFIGELPFAVRFSRPTAEISAKERKMISLVPDLIPLRFRYRASGRIDSLQKRDGKLLPSPLSDKG